MKSTVLFLNRNFYQYDEQIKKYLQYKDFYVISRSITPTFSIANKIVKYLSKHKIEKHNNVYQSNLVKEIKDEKIDIIFVLAGQGLLEHTLETLKKDHPEALFCWYIWDSIDNIDVFNKNKTYFDLIISFDKVEAQNYGFKYIPLFYIQEKITQEKIYDICMIGQDRNFRRNAIDKIIDMKLFKRSFFFLYAGYAEIFKSLLHFDLKSIRFLKGRLLNYNDTLMIMNKSRIILDIPISNQTGLTMRTIETLGIHTKLITTNKQVINYDFYDSNNICIIDIDDIEIPNIFIESAYKEIDKNIVKNYSIDSWCDQLVQMWRSYAKKND